ncbi:ribosome biogenesis GTPase Der [Helicobacter didelphidarum]|uniref:ribosome biogenesis GTPase Der n=1 Tax=Helicobacter didelphidarum TaxID=2040648 RepID=UPI00319E0525
MRENISHHSYQIITQSDIIIYIVDGNTPIASDEDIKIFRELNKQKPTILVLNKIDNDKIALNLSHFMSFGVEFFPISVSHNRGITKLLTHLEDIIESLIKAKKLKNPAISSSNTESLEPLELDFMDYFDNDASIIQFTKEKTQTNIFQHNKKSQSGQDSKEWQNDIDTNKFMCEESNIKEKTQQTISVGIIGRPNVGKSSLLNALTQQNRSLVSSIAGTTIDPVDESIFYKDYRITFIDTAGIRRRSKIDGIEKYALDRTQRILRQCDIALLVLDSSTDFVELDEKISSIASNNHLGLIVVFNKWDIRIKEFDEQMQIYKHKFKFLEYAPTLTISSITHKHIKELKQKILEVYSYFQFRIPTAQLNICIQNALKKHPIPSDHGKLVKIYYATQFDSKPPKIALMMNRPHALHFSYKRYLINILRQQFKFLGVPIIIEARSKKQSNDEEIE